MTTVGEDMDSIPATSTFAIPHRDFRIDLFRGLSLWMIYVDHFPGNFLSGLTLRNFGFSDAAEIFVFLSGYSAGLVYGRLAVSHGLGLGSLHAMRRGAEIYVAHLLLFIAYIVEVYFLAHGREYFLHYANIAVVLTDPGNAILQALILRYSPVNLDALPLFVIMHLAIPIMLWAFARSPALALLSSAGLYALAYILDWSFSAYPKGTIYFNPLNWQFLFVIGVWLGLGGVKALEPLLRSRALTLACSAFLAISLVIVLSWQIPALQVLLPAAVDAIYPIDKGSLAPLRLFHFLALAMLCWRFIPTNSSVLGSRLFRPLVQCGEHSLPVFCLGVLLSFAAHVVTEDISDGRAMQLIVATLGISAMCAVAAFLSAVDRTGESHPRTI